MDEILTKTFQVVIIFLFIIGYIGNLLTIVVLKFEKGLRPFTKIMMIMQAFWDSMFLLVPGMRYYFLIRDKYDIRKLSQTFKMVHLYLTFLIVDCSVWHLCTVAIERMCLVVWPTNSLIRRVSYKEAIILSFIFVIFSSFVHSEMYFDTSLTIMISYYIVLSIAMIIPFFVIAFSTFMILKKLKTSFPKVTPNGQTKSNNNQLFAIKMVLVVSFYYLLTATPMVIVVMLTNDKVVSPSTVSDVLIKSVNIAAILITSDHSVKFYLYTISVPHLRKVFIKIIMGLWHKLINKSHENIQGNVTAEVETTVKSD